MIFNHPSHRILTVFFLTLMFFLIAQTFSFAAKKDKKKGYVMTEVELQSELMSYADRFASIITQALEDFETLNPKPQARQVILSDLVYSISSVYTIAAEPNPQVGLLDMVAVTTLGRIVYEDNMRRKYGKSTEVLAAGFRQMEKDIWSITAKVLTSEQRGELRQLILLWRKNNPDKVVYNYLRFSDFAAQRRNSTLVKKVQAGGLFKTVQGGDPAGRRDPHACRAGHFPGNPPAAADGKFRRSVDVAVAGQPGDKQDPGGYSHRFHGVGTYGHRRRATAGSIDERYIQTALADGQPGYERNRRME